jgi:hypothetical protein
MSDDDGVLGAARRLARHVAAAVDKVEDAVEEVFQGERAPGDHDQDVRRPEPRPRPRPSGHPVTPPPVPEEREHAGGCCCCCCRSCGDGAGCHGGHGGHGGHGEHGGDGGGQGGRPTRNPGHDRGGLDGTPVTVGDINGRPPADSWPGPRKDLPLPFLFFRANAGDTGSRPAVGAFWESPDVYLLAGVHPSAAPPVPAKLGETALAGQPNTVYAHVWNFGRAAAHDVLVEFWWCNPALGVNPAGAHLIGRAMTHLGARGSGHTHHVVKCPEPWVPTFVNGGHECLLVRAWDTTGDLLTTPEWDASVNRHLGQRNVHVVSAAEAASLTDNPLTIGVGPLFGASATLRVQREHPANVPWLQLHTGVRGKFPDPAPATGALGLTVAGGAPADTHRVEGDGQKVTLHATDDPPPPGSAHVYRVTGAQGGATFGGYTVVVVG